MKAQKTSEFVVLTLGLLALCHIALADGVRTVFVNPSSIEPIYLSMGKSTVLRFRENPRKIVIGNQNYFGVEFIDKDVAIQPTGQIKTNLFVYTENRTYGFYLIVGNNRGDDLVKVEWQPIEYRQKETVKSVSPMIKPHKFSGSSFKLGNELKITPEILQFSPDHKLYVLDLNVQNKGQRELNLSGLSILAVKDKLSLSKQILVKEVEILKPNQISKLRLFFGLNEKSDVTINFLNKRDRAEFRLKRKYF